MALNADEAQRAICGLGIRRIGIALLDVVVCAGCVDRLVELGVAADGYGAVLARYAGPARPIYEDEITTAPCAECSGRVTA